MECGGPMNNRKDGFYPNDAVEVSKEDPLNELPSNDELALACKSCH